MESEWRVVIGAWWVVGWCWLVRHGRWAVVWCLVGGRLVVVGVVGSGS